MSARAFKPPSLLPSMGLREWGLGFALAVMAGLTSLALVFAAASSRAETMWRAQLSANLTVIVTPAAGQSFDQAAAHAADTLITVPGVYSAKPMTRARAEHLLAPWVGKTLPADMPLPALVEVETDPEDGPNAASIQKTLIEHQIEAEIETFESWRDSLARAAGAVRLMGWAAFAGLTAAAGAIAAFAALTGLEAKRHIVDILHLVGAEDQQISQLFEARYAGLVLRAATVGVLIAFGLALIMAFLGGQDDFAPSLRLTLADVLRMALVPLGLAAVAWLSARLAVLQALARMD